jgi:hypothetical protein
VHICRFANINDKHGSVLISVDVLKLYVGYHDEDVPKALIDRKLVAKVSAQYLKGTDMH